MGQVDSTCTALPLPLAPSPPPAPRRVVAPGCDRLVTSPNASTHGKGRPTNTITDWTKTKSSHVIGSQVQSWPMGVIQIYTQRYHEQRAVHRLARRRLLRAAHDSRGNADRRECGSTPQTPTPIGRSRNKVTRHCFTTQGWPMRITPRYIQPCRGGGRDWLEHRGVAVQIEFESKL
jgi:hypothetical protein